MNHPFLKSPAGENPVVIEAEFKANVSRLFQAWTREEDFIQWFGPEKNCSKTAHLDASVDGKWEFTFTYQDGTTDKLFGKYLTVEENVRLVFSWKHCHTHIDGTNESTPESIVTLAFESRGSGSYMRLEHKSISTESARINVGGGWSASVAQMLELIG